jgi:hypothetical protein
MKNGLYIIIALIAGFFLGKYGCSKQTEQVVEYKELPPKVVAITKPTPIKEYFCDVPKWLYFEKIDTVTKEVKQVVDTTAILQDWAKKRQYVGELFSDSTGHAEYTAEVQYNQLQLLTHTYTPLQKVVTTTVYKTDAFAPFIFVGADSRQYITVQAGAFIKNYAIAVDGGVGLNGGRYCGIRVGMKF